MDFLKNIFETRKILDDKPFKFFFPNPVNRIQFFSVILEWILSKKIVVAMLQSSCLKLKHENIASIKTAHVRKIMWIILSWICNMYMPWHHYGRHFYTQSWLIKVHLFYQWPESHCPYLLGIRYYSKHSRNILNFSTGKLYNSEILMAFASDILQEKVWFNNCSILSCTLCYVNFLIVDSITTIYVLNLE